MSFYPQPYKYQCGPFALKYGLVMLGRFENEKEIGKKAGSTWWYGTDEIGLAKAAKSFDCRMKYFKREDPKEAVKVLVKHLKLGMPCILSVDNWEHWFTVINEQQGRFIIVDSGLDKVIVTYSAAQLIKRWRYKDEEGNVSFDAYALASKYKPLTQANFSLEKARYVMRERNKQLAERWDTYFNDLITICRPRNPLSKRTISFNEFLRRHEKLLVKEIADWHGTPTYREIKKVLKNFQFVADVYDLIIRVEDQKKALIDLSAILMMYACGKYGMDPIY
ncbi:MAG TPA: cysteine peptidase family C39 domain-containing protein [Ignavibacteriaceae bacterium]|nr:cysteine peptidase family C39 domain-containing protein [Ignavibacteriaceae bacterium]